MGGGENKQKTTHVKMTMSMEQVLTMMYCLWYEKLMYLLNIICNLKINELYV